MNDTPIQARLRAISGLGLSATPRTFAQRVPDYYQARLAQVRDNERIRVKQRRSTRLPKGPA